MSWDAVLFDDRGHLEGDWNYTHNCNGMANVVVESEHERLRAAGVWRDDDEGRSWWWRLDGLEGPHGAQLLDVIVRGLEAEPDRFRAMNPPNGWGDYDSFLATLREMRDRVPEWPTVWSTSG